MVHRIYDLHNSCFGDNRFLRNTRWMFKTHRRDRSLGSQSLAPLQLGFRPQRPFTHKSLFGTTPSDEWHSRAASIQTEAGDDVVVSVKMKGSGDIYVGRLTSYPIVPDIEPDKDFLIIQTHYYKSGNYQDGQDLTAIDEIGAVLLNSGNVESIRVIYPPALDSDSIDDDSE